MAIKQVEIGLGVRPERRSRRHWALALAIVVGLGSVPLVFEGTKLCYGMWMEALETPVEVRTPILDRISETVSTVREGAWGDVRSFFNRASWDPKMVMLFAIAVMFVAMLLLRL